jgi:hypothetical protein
MRKPFPFLIGLAVFLALLWTLPALWCRRGAAGWYAGDRTTQDRLASTVAVQVQRGLSTDDYHTPSELFDGEWLFGTYLMAGIGFCQIVQQHPEDLEKWRPTIEHCISELLSPRVRAFDRKAWDRDALESLEAPNGHAAYLGYLNFLLSLYRQIDPGNRFAGLNDLITETLIRRTEASPNGLIETYPGEWYPVDNAPGLASVALQALATGRGRAEFLARQQDLYRRKLIDPQTGLLAQSVRGDGTLRDSHRGSGSTLAIFFLSRGCPELASAMFQGVQNHLATSLFNFGAIREYPPGARGWGDIDSGPVIFGFGFSASGFGLGGARAFRDEKLFSGLYASAILAGAPLRTREKTDFLTAGPLGNAILLAMFTTPFVSP